MYVIYLHNPPFGDYFWGGDEPYPVWGTLDFAYTYKTLDLAQTEMNSNVVLKTIQGNQLHKLQVITLQDAQVLEVMDS